METSYEAFTDSYYDVGLSSTTHLPIDRASPETPLECKQEIDATGLFDFIICGVLVNVIGLFGIFGNAISMIILSRPQMKSSINYLLIGLARCDTVLIVIAVSPLPARPFSFIPGTVSGDSGRLTIYASTSAAGRAP